MSSRWPPAQKTCGYIEPSYLRESVSSLSEPPSVHFSGFATHSFPSSTIQSSAHHHTPAYPAMVSIKTPLLLLAAALSLVTTHSTPPRVHPSVHRTLRRQGTVNIFVTLKVTPEVVLQSIEEAEFETRGAKITSLIQKLEAHATETQSELNALFATESASKGERDNSQQPLYKRKKSFWISNEVYFEDASPELVGKLSTLASLATVREEALLSLPEQAETDGTSHNVTESSTRMLQTTGEPWGVAKIGAPDVWAMGYTRQNVVVGYIGTGVQSTHAAVKDSFRGAYGWYDPLAKSATLVETAGIGGTHTMGTMVGANGYGVAPGAKWMACRMCDQGSNKSCKESDMFACYQFMYCPTDPSGNNQDCSKAPDIVNTGWDIPSDENLATHKFLVHVLRCGSTFAPGNFATVIGVGSTYEDDSLHPRSARGPAPDDSVKPDLVAPGGKIMAPSYLSDTDVKLISGTYVGASHVAGAVALVLSAHPYLDFDQVKSVLTSTAVTSVAAAAYTCGLPSDSQIPNNMFGYGRLGALAAVKKALSFTPADRCAPLSEVLCSEFLCEWRADTRMCSSWM